MAWTRRTLGIAVAAIFFACAPHPAPVLETPPAYEQRDQPATDEDLEILLRADEILADESKWDRKDDRVCEPDDTSWSLFCALQKASVDILGEYQHRRVAIQEVRFAVEEATSGMDLEHRLMDFNNLPSTRFEDVKRVLTEAIERVQSRLSIERRCHDGYSPRSISCTGLVRRSRCLASIARTHLAPSGRRGLAPCRPGGRQLAPVKFGL